MNILFLGNSHTFCNGLPFQVRELLRVSVPHVETTMLATPGVTLGWHAQQPETQMAILYQDWDYVILQEKTHPFDGYDVLLSDCRALLPYLHKTQAQVLLFMTWAEKRFPENQIILDDAFLRVAKDIGAAPMPVSKAWQSVLQAHPDIGLYDTDGEHASPSGSYLVACVFYGVISGRSPVGLPGRIYVRGDELVNMPKEHAARIQAAAWWAVQSTRPSDGRADS